MLNRILAMMTSLRHLTAICGLVAASASSSLANEPPPVPEGGLAILHEQPCSDGETMQKGYCYYMQDTEGNVYVTFWQGETLQFIRKIVGESYETVWENDIYRGI